MPCPEKATNNNLLQVPKAIMQSLALCMRYLHNITPNVPNLDLQQTRPSLKTAHGDIGPPMTSVGAPSPALYNNTRVPSPATGLDNEAHYRCHM